MKTILFKIWKFPQLSETFIVNQIVTATKLNYDVKILVGELNNIDGNSNTKLFEKYNLLDKCVIEDYNIPNLKILRYLRAMLLLLQNISLFKLLFKYYKLKGQRGILPLFEFDYYKKFRDINVIHIQFGTNKHPIDLLKSIGFIKAKVIVSFHGHDLHFPINGYIYNNGYYNKLFEISEYLICNTDYLKNKATALGALDNKIKIIPVAVDTTLFKPVDLKRERKKIRLLTVGRLDELKGHVYGLRAVKKLIEEGYDLEYNIVGIGTHQNNLEKEIIDLDLALHVNLLGALMPQEVLIQYQRSDVFLMTSITNSLGMAESQGVVTAEAQSCGLPIVAFDSGGVKYTFLDNVTGFLCPEKDTDCYVAKLKRLIDNPTLRREMGESANKFIESGFSENSVLSKWKELYG